VITLLQFHHIDFIPTSEFVKFQVNRFAGRLCLLAWLLFLPVSVFAVAPSITTQPQSTNGLAGANATFKVTASGSATLVYRWSFNGTNLVNSTHIGGATNSTLTVTNLAANDAGNYRVVVTNFQGSVTSSIAALTVWLPPVITVSPTNFSVLQSNNAAFTVTATGTTNLIYHWQRGTTNLVNGGRISGATNATLTVTGVLTNDAGSYHVIVTNLYGSVTSAVATLTVLVPAKIISQPANQSLLVGSAASFSVTADGTSPLNFRWSLNGTNLVNSAHISGATNATLTVSNLVVGDAGNYSVTVTNNYGSAISSNAQLTVLQPAFISSSPTNQSVLQNSNVTLVVAAGGTTNLNYQWQRGGTNLANGGRISGATNAALTITGALTNDAGSYRVIVTNLYGSATSAVATLTVLVPAKIITQPASQTVLAGTPAVFSVTADGTVPLNYQWSLNGTNLANSAHISGATNATLTVSNLVASDAGNYSVTVTNNYGSDTSSNAALTVVFAPAISTQPVGQAVDVGTPFTFAVSATGTAPLNYQWLFNGLLLSGQTNSTLSYAAAAMNQAGNYSVVVTNLYGSVTSSNALLQVTNALPIITALASQRTFPTVATKPMIFTVGDLETPVENLVVTGVATDTNLVPTANIIFSGSGANRTVVVTPASGLSGSTVITVTVMDGQGATASANFMLTVAGFTDIGAGMTGVWSGNASWGDYDNDGKLDVLVNGKDGSGNGITKIYRNAGGGTFTDIGADVQGLYAGSAAWGDYNNDGKLDFMLNGSTSNSVLTWLIYRNNGSNNFVQTANLNNIGYGGSVLKFISLGWGDYDNDGRLDALFFGWPYCSLFHNAGGDTFTDSGARQRGRKL